MGSGEGFTMKNSLCCSSNVFRMIRFGRLRWAGHVARIECVFRTIEFNLQERGLWEVRGVDWKNIRIDLKGILVCVKSKNWVD